MEDVYVLLEMLAVNELISTAFLKLHELVILTAIQYHKWISQLILCLKNAPTYYFNQILLLHKKWLVALLPQIIFEI